MRVKRSSLPDLVTHMITHSKAYCSIWRVKSQTTIHTWSRAEMDLRVGREVTVLFFGRAVPLKKKNMK